VAASQELQDAPLQIDAAATAAAITIFVSRDRIRFARSQRSEIKRLASWALPV